MNLPSIDNQFNPEATVAEALRIVRERVHDATPGKSKKNEHTIFLFPFSHLVQAGFIRSFEFFKKFWKSLGFFFLATTFYSVINDFFFVLFRSYSISASYVCSVSWKKRCFAFLKVYIDHLFDKLESGKINKLFWKKVWKKSWMLDPKICTNPVQVNAPQVQDQYSLNWFWGYN